MDNEDNMTLAVLKEREDNTTLAVLKERKADSSLKSSISCDFCDKHFSTKFASFKHNATHIVIPLIKLAVYQCDDCLYHYTSLDKLREHAINKNHTSSQLGLKTPHRKPSIEYEEILQSIVEKQVVVKCHDIISQVLSNKGKCINNISIRKSSLSSLKELKRKVIENGSVNSEIIPTFEISSESDNDSSVSEQVTSKRVTNNPETDKRNPKQDESNSEINHCHSEKGESHSERKHGNSEKGESHPERNHSNSEKGESHQERNHNNSERGESNSEREHQDNSSPFEFGSFKDSTSLNKDMSSPIYEPISTRIRFEDEFDDDLFEAETILPDKPYSQEKYTDHKYIIGNKKTNNLDRTANSLRVGSQLSADLKTLDNSDLNEEVKGLVESYTSVHYDDLIEAKLCDCRYCGRVFFNRLELIKHETTHLRLRRARPALCALCERYLAGKRALRNHMTTKHPSEKNKNLPLHKCFTCKLRYHNYYRHIRYYHHIQCATCKGRFDKDQIKNHECFGPFRFNKCKVIKLCGMCLSFAKNQQNRHYEVMGEVSEVGKRQQCDMCNSVCFEVNLVKRKTCKKKLQVDDLGFVRQRKSISNKDRLRKMQRRLKMVNKMNKCWFLVSFRLWLLPIYLPII